MDYLFGQGIYRGTPCDKVPAMSAPLYLPSAMQQREGEGGGGVKHPPPTHCPTPHFLSPHATAAATAAAVHAVAAAAAAAAAKAADAAAAAASCCSQPPAFATAGPVWSVRFIQWIIMRMIFISGIQNQQQYLLALGRTVGSTVSIAAARILLRHQRWRIII